MKKLLLSAFLVSSFAASAQLTVFEDDFEAYEDFAITGFGDWITIDFDMLNTYTGGDAPTPWPNAGEPQAWMIFNPSVAQVTNSTDECTATLENRNFDPHSGSKYAASWASALTGGSPVNDDKLISPVLNLGASNNELTFWVKSMSSCYGLEEFRVYVYSGTGIPTSISEFVQISGLTAQTAPYPDWELKTYTLNYSNEPIRIGIRNVGDDHYMLMVDDFRVTSSNLSVNEVLAGKFSTYPNPSTGVINISNTESIHVNAISITDLNGRVVKNINYTDAPQNIELNVSDLSSGMYMMNIDSDAGSATKKIVKI